MMASTWHSDWAATGFDLIARKVFSLELFLCASSDFVQQLAEPITVRRS